VALLIRVYRNRKNTSGIKAMKLDIATPRTSEELNFTNLPFRKAMKSKADAARPVVVPKFLGIKTTSK
jgi:hypothetical protein